MVKTSYKSEDVTVLLQDMTGQLSPLSTEEREKRIQQGTHYSEMCPLETLPSDVYKSLYYSTLKLNGPTIAYYIQILSQHIHKLHGDKVVILSLARAGTPYGILLKRYMERYLHMEVEHYTISIIRGRGIDKQALNYVREHSNCNVNHWIFVDGWTGKGAIFKTLKEALSHYVDPFLKPELYCIADPAYITEHCSTHEDVLLPTAMLNSICHGLMSRTIYTDEDEMHGAVYFSEFEPYDLSNQFLDEITKHFVVPRTLDVIMKEYNVKDVNKIKPGIGETTRVLLRRVPERILVNSKYSSESLDIAHIFRLALEKNVPIEYTDTGAYKCIGIIKELSDA